MAAISTDPSRWSGLRFNGRSAAERRSCFMPSALAFTPSCVPTFLAVLLELLPAWAAWLGAALFAVHPLHVEAVANVVGQSELLAALFMFLALLVFLRARRRGPVGAPAISVITFLYVIACLSKEHAIVLPALLLAAEGTVFATPAKPLRERLGALRLLGLTMAAAGLAFLWARFHVLGAKVAASDEANALLLGQPFSIRMMTMLRVLLEWVRLFLWPARLSADYSPQAIALVTGPSPRCWPAPRSSSDSPGSRGLPASVCRLRHLRFCGS